MPHIPKCLQETVDTSLEVAACDSQMQNIVRDQLENLKLDSHTANEDEMIKARKGNILRLLHDELVVGNNCVGSTHKRHPHKAGYRRVSGPVRARYHPNIQLYLLISKVPMTHTFQMFSFQIIQDIDIGVSKQGIQIEEILNTGLKQLGHVAKQLAVVSEEFNNQEQLPVSVEDNLHAEYSTVLPIQLADTIEDKHTTLQSTPNKYADVPPKRKVHTKSMHVTQKRPRVEKSGKGACLVLNGSHS